MEPKESDHPGRRCSFLDRMCYTVAKGSLLAMRSEANLNSRWFGGSTDAVQVPRRGGGGKRDQTLQTMVLGVWSTDTYITSRPLLCLSQKSLANNIHMYVQTRCLARVEPNPASPGVSCPDAGITFPVAPGPRQRQTQNRGSGADKLASFCCYWDWPSWYCCRGNCRVSGSKLRPPVRLMTVGEGKLCAGWESGIGFGSP